MRFRLSTSTCIPAVTLILFSTHPVLVATPPVHAQDVACAVPVPADPPAAAADLEQVRTIASGVGVKVAVIDTGVAQHPELNQLIPGNDYVTPDEPRPFDDCDAHGTVVAGIIAGTTTGIAPDAEIIAIRQSSAHFRTPPAPVDAPPDAADIPGAGNLDTLARAIHNAIDLGADVINMSVVSCVEPQLAARVDTQDLRLALGRAELDGVVVVAAAGNANHECPPGSTVYPAHFPTVITVGSRADTHTMAEYSLPVPDGHVSVSAPGRPQAALSSDGNGFTDGVAGDRGAVQPFEGTSFAAPVVSATVALLRQRYPDATPAQIRTMVDGAAEPSGGAVDTLTALTHLPPESHRPSRAEGTGPLTVAPVEKTVATAPRKTGVVLTILGLFALLSTAVGSLLVSRRNI